MSVSILCKILETLVTFTKLPDECVNFGDLCLYGSLNGIMCAFKYPISNFPYFALKRS